MEIVLRDLRHSCQDSPVHDSLDLAAHEDVKGLEEVLSDDVRVSVRDHVYGVRVCQAKQAHRCLERSSYTIDRSLVIILDFIGPSPKCFVGQSR